MLCAVVDVVVEVELVEVLLGERTPLARTAATAATMMTTMRIVVIIILDMPDRFIPDFGNKSLVDKFIVQVVKMTTKPPQNWLSFTT